MYKDQDEDNFTEHKPGEDLSKHQFVPLVDLTVELHSKLPILGIPVKGSTPLLFGDNEPRSILKKRHLANCYHRVKGCGNLRRD